MTRRVLEVITDSFSAQLFVAPLAHYLTGNDWQVIIACSGRPYMDAHTFTDRMAADHLDVRDIPIARTISLPTDLLNIVRLSRLIRREHVDLVHTHLSKGGIIGRIAARLAGVPALHTVYDYAFVEAAGIRRLCYRQAERAAAHLCRSTMFISESERRINVAEHIGGSGRQVTIGWGIDLERFNPQRLAAAQVRQLRKRFSIPDSALVVGTVARLVARKRVDLLLKAVSASRAKHPNLHTLIVGGGPLELELRHLVRSLGLADSVSFTGFIDDPDDLPSLYSAMDVFCLASQREGYGMVCAEAGAMERPVVACDIPPLSDIVVSGETGLLVSRPTPEAIAAALDKLLSDSQLRQQMGREASRFVSEHCDLRTTFPAVLEEYRQALVN